MDVQMDEAGGTHGVSSSREEVWDVFLKSPGRSTSSRPQRPRTGLRPDDQGGERRKNQGRLKSLMVRGGLAGVYRRLSRSPMPSHAVRLFPRPGAASRPASAACLARWLFGQGPPSENFPSEDELQKIWCAAAEAERE
jgi:hypothetical protein